MDKRRQGKDAGEATSAAAAAMPVSLAPDISSPFLSFLTLELAAYVSLFILGFAVRIGHLGAYPLDFGEAARALSGWQLVHGQAPVTWQEPLVVLSAALTFLTLGDTDVLARLVPVVVGSLLVVSPWLLRNQIGRIGALLASLFLALSPTAVFYSRNLSADVFAAALSIALFACIVRYLSEREARWAIIGSGALALLLNSGAPGFTFLLVLVAFFALTAALGKSSNEYLQAWASLKADSSAMKQAGGVLVGGFVLVGTGFLSTLAGLKLPALSAWVLGFNLVPEGRPWYFHLELLLGYEPLIFLIGATAAVYYIYLWQRPQGRQALGIKGFLIFWAAAGFLAVAFTGSKYGGQLLVSVVPLALLAGCLLGDLEPWACLRERFGDVGFLVASTPFLVYALLVVSDLTQKSRLALWYQWINVFLALVLVAILAVAGVAYGGGKATRFILLIGLSLLLAYSVHATWRTVYWPSEQEMLAPSVVSTGLVDAVDEIGEVAASQFLGNSITIAVQPDLQLPMEWYLRNYTGVQYTNNPPQGTQAIIWQVDQPPPVNLDEYIARKARATTVWSKGGAKFGDIWRWLLYREPFGQSKAAEVMLYLQKEQN